MANIEQWYGTLKEEDPAKKELWAKYFADPQVVKMQSQLMAFIEGLSVELSVGKSDQKLRELDVMENIIRVYQRTFYPQLFGNEYRDN